MLQSGRLSEAIEQLNAAVNLDSTLAPAHENLGVALARAGHLPDAIEQFNDALEIDPSAWPVHDDLGIALAKSGRISESVEQFQRALQLNPNDAAAQQNLARLQAYLDNRNGPASAAPKGP